MLAQKCLSDPCSQYRNNQVFTSSPLELVVMLYDGALRFVRRAAAAMEGQKYDEVHFNVDRAQQIVTELTASLDLDQGELSKNLYSLYEYIHLRLTEADLGRKGEPLSEAEKILLSLRESWAGASRIARRKG